MLELLISGGIVFDGSGSAGQRLDIGISQNRLKLFATGSAPKAAKTLDATNLVIAPGFIDVHSHSDLSLLALPTLYDKIMQGVTTEIIGNCGLSPYPLTNMICGNEKEVSRDRSANQQIQNERLTMIAHDLMRLVAPFDWTPEWRTCSEYLKTVKKVGSDTNIVTLVGHSTLRAAVMGIADRSATNHELQQMERLLEQCLDQGSAGMSLGLLYAPGCYADLRELSSLATVVASRGGVVASHMRNYGGDITNSLEEMLEMAKLSGVKLQISHMMAPNAQTANKALKLLAAARNNNIHVWYDQYPYTRAMTSALTLLPPWALAGGREQTVERLADEDSRNRIAYDIQNGISGWENIVASVGWSNIVIIEPSEHQWAKMNLTHVHEHTGQPPLKCYLKFLQETEAMGTITVALTDEQALEIFMKDTYQCFGSDGMPRVGLTHPRTYGTYPRIIGTYCRDKNVLELEEAIQKCTSIPAQRFGITDRGLVVDDAYADLVVFSLKDIDDRGSYTRVSEPSGIVYVLVNGQIVVDEGKPTGIKPGELLLGSGF